jgi:hypothetical protein
MQTRCLVVGGAALLMLVTSATAAQEPNQSPYVSRKEYDALKKELEDVKARLPSRRGTVESQAQLNETGGSQTLSRRLDEALAIAEASGLGDTKMLIAGDASAGFSNPKHASSTFEAEFNPMLLWQLNERFFFEGAMELSLSGPDENGENSSSDVELDSAYLTYLINDWVAAVAGKFTVPFTAYHNHLDPSWINKLPGDPLVYGDGGIAPDSGVGALVTGVLPCEQAAFNYAVFITNGPALITDDPDAAGSLNFDNYNDTNHNKALGFRLGWLPLTGLEAGYSFEFSRPNPSGFETVHSTLHGLDLNYVSHVESVGGQITGRGAYVWSNLSEATYDPTGALGFGPLRFRNNRNGGYAELAYRPTDATTIVIRNLEFVARYDRLDIPSAAPGGGTHEQWTGGIDYWVTSRTVLKAAYTFDDTHGGDNQNLFALQFATGF